MVGDGGGDTGTVAVGAGCVTVGKAVGSVPASSVGDTATGDACTGVAVAPSPPRRHEHKGKQKKKSAYFRPHGELGFTIM